MGTDESIKAHEIPWSYCMNVHLPASLCSFFFSKGISRVSRGFQPPYSFSWQDGDGAPENA